MAERLTVDQEVGGSSSTQLYHIDQEFQPVMAQALYWYEQTVLSGPAADLAEQRFSFCGQT